MSNKYKRILIKLSGGAISGEKSFGFEPNAIEHIVREVLSIRDQGIQVCIVIGGGNIFRGNIAKSWGIERAEADNIGMLGTIINSLMLRAALKARSNYEVRVMTALKMESTAETYIRLRAINHLEKGYIVILAGGIGQPYVTTDYTAVQRALETRCEAIFVAKEGIDGVYDSDPKHNPDAVMYDTLAYDNFLDKNLPVFDQSGILLAKEYGIPMHLFNFDEENSMKRIFHGEHIGTFVSPETKLKVNKAYN